MPTIATIIIERRDDDIWSAKFAESDRFHGEAQELGTAVVRLIDSIGHGTVRFDSWIETEQLKRDNYREFRVPLTPQGALAMRADTSTLQQPLLKECHFSVR